MKKYCALFAIGALSSVHAIEVSLNGTAGQAGDSLLDSGGSPISVGTLGLLIVDTAGDGVEIPVGSFSPDSFIGSTDNFLVSMLEASDVFGNRVIGFSNQPANNPGLSQGDEFYIAWFPGSTIATTSFVGGENYGITTRTASPDPWVLPPDTFSNTSAAAPGGSANLTVVPEPQTYAMIAGFLGLGLALIRRRR